MVPLAIVGRAVASGVGEGVGVARAGVSSDGGTGVADGDFVGDGVGDPFVFFFFNGVGVFLAVAFFFFGDALGFGVGDLAGLGEAFEVL